MPYRWTDTASEKTLRLWPHQSLTRSGFTWFIGATVILLAVPLFAVLGSPILWVLLGFMLAAVGGVWRAIMRNRADRTMHEELTLNHEQVRILHVPANGPPQSWEANPYWVTVHLRNDGPVEKYLTLRGGGREVQLGAFLTPDEREGLYDELTRALKVA